MTDYELIRQALERAEDALCYKKDIYEALAALDRIQGQGWISVEDDLPETCGWYDVWVCGERQTDVYFDGNWREDMHDRHRMDDVTHWQPLPQPPQSRR